MQQTEAQPVQLSAREFLKRFGGGSGHDLVGSLHQRAHHVDLARRGHLGPNLLPRRDHFHLGARPHRNDLRAARRQLVEDGRVEVAIDGHGRGARDGRGGHDEHVRIVVAGLFPQRGALLDAEAVLLVDHNHAKAMKRNGLRDEGVRADQQVDRARAQRGVQLAPFGRRGATRQQRHADRTGTAEHRGVVDLE